MDYKLPKMPERPENSNKGTFGKILNVSGSKYMTGAAYLSCVSALKTGAGYVELASCKEALKAAASYTPEIVLSPIEKIPELLKQATVLLIGCGLSTTQEAKEIFYKTIERRGNIPTVIDADGLNILSELNLSFDGNVILTPHPKEASRLLNCSLEEILENFENSAKEISKKFNCVTVLKSHKTIVTSPDNKIYYNTTGNSALAKAGSGDVLAGMLAGLLAQKMNIFDAAVLGVYLHGLAGDLAKEDLTAYGVLASDTVRYIPYAIKQYLLTKNI